MAQLVIPSSEIERQRVDPAVVRAYAEARIPATAVHESLRALNVEAAKAGAARVADGYLPNYLRPITQYDPQTVDGKLSLDGKRSLRKVIANLEAATL